MTEIRRLGGAACLVSMLVIGAACASSHDLTVPDGDVGSDGDSGSARRRDAGAEGGSEAPDGGTSMESGTLPIANSGDGATPCAGGGVVLNEFQTQGANASDEFVELYNCGLSTVSLSGWKLQYRSSTDTLGLALHSFTASDTIAPGAFLFYASTNMAGKNGMLTPGMAAAAGQVGLLDSTGKIVDAVAYGAINSGTYLENTAALAPAATGSVGRKADGVDSNNNGVDFQTYATPTPGSANH